MYKKNVGKQSFKVKLVSNLHLAEQDRVEPPKGAYPGGRFKRFFDIFKANFQPLMILNLLAILFALPILALVLFFQFQGVELIGYMIAKTTKPYLMTSYGIGLSAGMPLHDAKIMLLNSYRVFISSIALGMPFLAFGFAGSMAVIKKMVWGESLLTTKNKEGKDIPRITTEFFRGVKKYWKKCLPLMVVTSIVFAGIANLVLNFVGAQWVASYKPVDIVSLIFAILLAVAYFPIFTNLLPTTVTYDMEFKNKLKNSAIITTTFFIPTVIILGLSILPFLLLMAGKIISLMVFVFILAFGVSFFSLVLINYNDYHHEKLIEPLYLAQQKAQFKKERKKKKAKRK